MEQESNISNHAQHLVISCQNADHVTVKSFGTSTVARYPAISSGLCAGPAKHAKKCEAARSSHETSVTGVMAVAHQGQRMQPSQRWSCDLDMSKMIKVTGFFDGFLMVFVWFLYGFLIFWSLGIQDTPEKNGKRGMLGHPSVHCWLLWFLCLCSMFLPYLWCFMWWGFRDYFPPNFHCWCLDWMGVGFV